MRRVTSCRETPRWIFSATCSDAYLVRQEMNGAYIMDDGVAWRLMGRGNRNWRTGSISCLKNHFGSSWSGFRIPASPLTFGHEHRCLVHPGGQGRSASVRYYNLNTNQKTQKTTPKTDSFSLYRHRQSGVVSVNS